MGHRDREEGPHEGGHGEPGTRPSLPGEVEKGERIDTIKRGMPEEQTAVEEARRAAASGKSPGVTIAQTAEEIDLDTPQDPPEGDVADHSGGLGGL